MAFGMGLDKSDVGAVRKAFPTSEFITIVFVQAFIFLLFCITN